MVFIPPVFVAPISRKNTLWQSINTFLGARLRISFNITSSGSKMTICIVLSFEITNAYGLWPVSYTHLWKVWQRRIEVSAGKISRLEIRSAPIMRMPRTVVMAVKNASSVSSPHLSLLISLYVPPHIPANWNLRERGGLLFRLVVFCCRS